MGVLFTLTPEIKAITQQALDDLITELAKDCVLLYPPIMEACTSSGYHQLSGGFVPPGFSRCQFCDGSGFREVQTTETIQMTVVASPAHFYRKLPRNIDIPDGLIQTKCYAADVVKIKQAREMQLQPELDALLRPRYKLVGEPIDVSSIIPGRYFIAMWERIQ